MNQRRAKLINRYIKKIGAENKGSNISVDIAKGIPIKVTQHITFHSMKHDIKAMYDSANFITKTLLAKEITNYLKENA